MENLTIDIIREWLAENKDSKEVKAFFDEVAKGPDIDSVRKFLETAEGKSLLQPITDKRVTEALQTYKENHYDKDLKAGVAAEILRLNPQESPLEKQIRELTDKMAETERKAAQADLRRKIVERAAQEKIDSWWVDEFSGNTIEEADVFLGKVKAYTDKVKTDAKNEILTTGFKPGSGTGGNGKKPDISKMSQEELIKLEMEGTLDTILQG